MSKRGFVEWSRMVEYLAREEGIDQHLPTLEELRERYRAAQTPSTVVACLSAVIADSEHCRDDYDYGDDDDDSPTRDQLDSRFVYRSGKSRAARVY